jgi:hypothetical protein
MFAVDFHVVWLRCQARLEMEKLHREEIRKRQKEENFLRFQAEAAERSRQVSMRDKEIADRMEFDKKKRDEETKAKREAHWEKLAEAQKELASMEKERKEAVSEQEPT